MSIIAQQTPFTLCNGTSHFLQVHIVAEQDNSFRVETNSDHVIPITEIEYAQDGSLFSSFVNSSEHPGRRKCGARCPLHEYAVVQNGDQIERQHGQYGWRI